jgi:hypothetical protein
MKVSNDPFTVKDKIPLSTPCNPAAFLSFLNQLTGHIGISNWHRFPKAIL